MSKQGQTELVSTPAHGSWPGRDGIVVGMFAVLVWLGWMLLPTTGGGRWYALVLLLDLGYLTVTRSLRR